MLSQRNHRVRLSVGSRVGVRQSPRAPYSGSYGIITSIDEVDGKGPYLVRFDDNIEFRYKADELVSVELPRPNNQKDLLGRIMKSQFHICFVLALVSLTLLVSSCGPPPNPKLQGKAAESQEQAPAREVEQPRPAPAPVAEPQPQVAAKPKPAAPVRQVPARQTQVSRPPSRVRHRHLRPPPRRPLQTLRER